MHRWRDGGSSIAVVAGRFRALRAALGWAYDERLIDLHPDAQHAWSSSSHAETTPARHRASGQRRHRCELDLLLVRLAADTGARRGELAALRIDDLHDRVPRIDRADSAGQLTSTKSGQGRTLTVGSTTAALWRTLSTGWEQRSGHPVGPWLFSADLDHRHRLDASTLGHRFARGETPPAFPMPPCTGSDTAWRPSWYLAVRSCRPRPDSGTPTPPRHSGSTPTPYR